LDEQLRRAPTVLDEGINIALEDFSFCLTDEQRRLLIECGHTGGRRLIALQTSANHSLTPLAAEISRRINGAHFLIAPLHSDGALNGLLVVDRSWQERQISDTDHAQLSGFLELAEFLLADHAQTRRFMEYLHDDALIGRLAGMLSQTLNAQRMRELARDVQNAQGSLTVLDYNGANATLESAKESLLHTARSLERLEALWKPATTPALVHPRTLVEDVVESLQQQLKKSGTEIRVVLGMRGDVLRDVVACAVRGSA
jgi:hypothetical protein